MVLNTKFYLQALVLMFLVGCSSNAITHFQGIAHTHSYHIQIAASLSTKEKQKIKTLIDEVFDEVNLCYNHWNPQSELSLVNQGSPSTPKLREILSLALMYKELTGGRYDPFLGGVISAWKESLKKGELPDLNPLHVAIDLDGMLKGYAIDLLVEKLNRLGYKHVYVEWGGDIRVSGRHPEKRPWRILIEGKVIPLYSALATSGNSEQKWEVGDKIFTHIIDPFSLRALEVKEMKSVTVQAPTCALADALATACMTFMSDREALEWAESIKAKQEGVAFWITTKP
ncbi:MAG: FAD:protein FMN transferase [Simkaniaceae bacterium]